MNTEKLDFNKVRTTGQIISFAFLIFRTNQKNFWKGLLVSVIPFFIVSGGLMAPTLLGEVFKSSGEARDINVLLFFLGVMIYCLALLILVTYVNEYVIAMKNNEETEQPHFRLIVRNTFNTFPRNILNGILFTILFAMLSSAVFMVIYIGVIIMAVGIITTSVIIGGISVIIFLLLMIMVSAYLYGCTFPIFFISAYEKKGFFKSLELNFSYTHRKKSFWPGLFVNVFGVILMYVIANNLSLPIYIVVGVIEYNSGTFAGSDDATIRAIFEYMNLAILVTMPVASFIMYISQAANYFTQKERARADGLKERIRKIGGPEEHDPTLELNF